MPRATADPDAGADDTDVAWAAAWFTVTRPPTVTSAGTAVCHRCAARVALGPRSRPRSRDLESHLPFCAGLHGPQGAAVPVSAGSSTDGRAPAAASAARKRPRDSGGATAAKTAALSKAPKSPPRPHRRQDAAPTTAVAANSGFPAAVDVDDDPCGEARLMWAEVFAAVDTIFGAVAPTPETTPRNDAAESAWPAPAPAPAPSARAVVLPRATQRFHASQRYPGVVYSTFASIDLTALGLPRFAPSDVVRGGRYAVHVQGTNVLAVGVAIDTRADAVLLAPESRRSAIPLTWVRKSELYAPPHSSDESETETRRESDAPVDNEGDASGRPARVSASVWAAAVDAVARLSVLTLENADNIILDVKGGGEEGEGSSAARAERIRRMRSDVGFSIL